jgi:hypothetical protein
MLEGRRYCTEGTVLDRLGAVGDIGIDEFCDGLFTGLTRNRSSEGVDDSSMSKSRNISFLKLINFVISIRCSLVPTRNT